MYGWGLFNPYWEHKLKKLPLLGKRKSSLCGINASLLQIRDCVMQEEQFLCPYIFENVTFSGMLHHRYYVYSNVKELRNSRIAAA